MRSTHRVGWGMAASVALHAALLLSLLRQAEPPALDQRPSRVMAVQLLPAARAPVQAGAAQEEAAPEAEPGTPLAAEAADSTPPSPASSTPERTDIYYYFPEELDRQLIVLRDHTGDHEIVLDKEVVIHLFVDLSGKVASIGFEGEPAPEVQEKIRAAFRTMEFMPGLRKGQAVPSRIKIGIAATPVLDTNVY